MNTLHAKEIKQLMNFSEKEIEWIKSTNSIMLNSLSKGHVELIISTSINIKNIMNYYESKGYNVSCNREISGLGFREMKISWIE
jgi:hypothetical protein